VADRRLHTIDVGDAAANEGGKSGRWVQPEVAIPPDSGAGA
jgi:hypothetical protein